MLSQILFGEILAILLRWCYNEFFKKKQTQIPCNYSSDTIYELCPTPSQQNLLQVCLSQI